MDALGLFEGLSINAFWALIVWIVARLYFRARRAARARALWPFADFKDLTIVVARTKDVDTGSYMRPQTGLGELRALALLAPSLDQADKDIDFQNVLTTDQIRDVKGDLIVLGGPKNNVLTQRILDSLPSGLEVSQSGSSIGWTGIVYNGKTIKDRVVDDYGLVIRMQSPFATGRKIVLLSGSHTFGVIAAARWYAESVKDAESLPRSKAHFAALVRSDVINEAVLEPRLLGSIVIAP